MGGWDRRGKGQSEDEQHFIWCPNRLVKIEGELDLAAEEAIFSIALIMS